MTTAGKLAQRAVHTGTFQGAQQQRLAQDAARQVNSHTDILNALTNRAYVNLKVDTSLTVSASYATLLTTTITTVLATGYLIIWVSTSGLQQTAAASEFLQVVVDGVVIKGTWTSTALGFAFTLPMMVRTAVTRGLHTVLLQWKVNASTWRINALTSNEEHAHMLIQEAA